MVKSFAQRLEEANSLADIFELVKEGVRKVYKTGRAGLSLGLAEIVSQENHLIGAFYPFGSNIIVMNKTPLKKIGETDPRLFKPYAFHILLHEYLHALGNIDEEYTRKIVYQISLELFGRRHTATKMAKDLNKFLPELAYSPLDFQPAEHLQIELVQDFDKSSISYIQ
ncbi:MAG: hypothetical protein ABH874_06190 [Methanobacteriota archaeon]